MNSELNMTKQSLNGIDQALQDRKILRAFRSGGGLRVVRIEDSRDGPLRGYGEDPNLMPALHDASDDYLAGGREYSEVYDKLKPHYLTGTTQAEDRLDLWVLQGHKLWAERKDGKVKVEARTFEDKRVVSALGDDFKTAYASLSELVTNEAFEKANGF
ncbi:MAG TPA: hypothetical protein VJH68_01585 [Candidatus Nanoarchaeia archaeon]|nr:hypothetical protein [Candidatus Nanoarchaeia archaeon]